MKNRITKSALVLSVVAILLLLTANLSQAECPCSVPSEGLLAMAIESPDATSKAEPSDIQPLPGKPISTQTELPSYSSDSALKLVRNRFVEYKSALEAMDFSRALILKDEINLTISRLRAEGVSTEEFDKDILLLGDERVWKLEIARWERENGVKNKTPEAPQMSSTNEIEMGCEPCEAKAKYYEMAENSVRGIDFLNDKEREYKVRSTLHNLASYLGIFDYSIEKGDIEGAIVTRNKIKITKSEATAERIDVSVFKEHFDRIEKAKLIAPDKAESDKDNWIAEELQSWLNNPAEITATKNDGNDSWLSRTGMYSTYHANRWSEKGIHAGFKPEDEVFEYRTLHSKTFRNPDGSFTAAFLSDLHYQDDAGNWRDIDLTISANNTAKLLEYEMSNQKNSFKTYYSADKSKGVAFETEGGIVKTLINSAISQKIGGSQVPVNTATVAPKLENRRVLKFDAITPNIDEQIVQLKRGIEHGYWLKSASWLAPSAEALVFSEEIEIPDGWEILVDDLPITSNFSAKEFTLKKPNSEDGVRYIPVRIFDARVPMDEIMKRAEVPVINDDTDDPLKTRPKDDYEVYSMASEYRVEFLDSGKLRVSYSVPAEWLKATDRQFPVYIDPLVELLTGSSATSSTNSGMPYNTYYHDQRCDFIVLNSDFTSAGLTNGATISTVGMYCSATAGMGLSNFRIRSQDTSLSTVGSWTTSGWVVNYGPTAQGTPSAGYWYDYGVSITFNSSYHKYFNVSRDNTSWSGSGGNYLRVTSTTRMGTGYSDSGYTWPYDGYGMSTWANIPHFRVTYTPPPRACDACTPVDTNLGTIGTTAWGYAVSGNCGYNGKWSASFNGEAGQLYHFDLCPDSPGSGTANFDIDIKILNSSCGILAGEDGSCVAASYRPNNFQWLCETSGTYYVILAPYYSYASHNCTGVSTNTFTMYYYKETFNACNVPPGVWEYAYPSYTGWAHYSGTTTSSILCKWYKVYMSTGYEYNFTTNLGASPSSGANFDTVLELYNEAGTYLTGNDDAYYTNGSFISYCPPSSGYYWLKVRGYGSYYGNYTVGMSYFSTGFGAPTGISVSPNPICTGTGVTITPSGGYGGGHYLTHTSPGTCGSFIGWNTYTWYPAAGSYTIYSERRVTSSYPSCLFGSTMGSGGAVSTSLTVGAQPTISISGGTTACYNTAVTLSSSVGGGAGTCSYQWQYYNGSAWQNVPSGGTGSTYAANPGPLRGASTDFRCIRSCTGSGCNNVTSNTQTVSLYNNGTALYNWVGNSNTSWSNCANWGKGYIPGGGDVIIPSSASYWPYLNGNYSVNSLTINSSGLLNITSNYTLTITGARSDGSYNNAIYLAGRIYQTTGTITSNYNTSDINAMRIMGTGRYDFDGGAFNRIGSISDDWPNSIRIESGGVWDQTAGTMTMDNNVGGYWWGTTVVAGGQLLLSGGSYYNDSYFYNYGTVSITGTGRLYTGYGAGPDNSGYYYNSGGATTVNGASAILYIGNTTYPVDFNNSNSGTALNINNGTFTVTRHLYNNSGATASMSAGAANIGYNLYNYSTFTKTGGTLTVTNDLVNISGTFSQSSGTTTINGSTSAYNGYSGIDVNSGSTLTASGGNLNINSGVNTGSLENRGGTINLSGATVSIAGYLYNYNGYSSETYISAGSVTCANIPNYGGIIVHSGGTIYDNGYYYEGYGATGGVYYGVGSAVLQLNGIANPWIDIDRDETYFNNVIINGAYTWYDYNSNARYYPMDIRGYFTINSGKSFTCASSNFNMEVYGNWTNHGSFVPNNNTVTFKGSINSQISGNSETSFYNLYLRKTSNSYYLEPLRSVRATNVDVTTTGGYLKLDVDPASRYILTP